MGILILYMDIQTIVMCTLTLLTNTSIETTVIGIYTLEKRTLTLVIGIETLVIVTWISGYGLTDPGDEHKETLTLVISIETLMS